MGVDEARDDGATAEVAPLVGGGRIGRAPDPLDDGVRPGAGDDEGRVAHDPEQPVAGVGARVVTARGVVGRQLGDARDEDAHEWTPPATRSMERPSSRPTSPMRCRPSLTMTSPPTTTVDTSEATQE